MAQTAISADRFQQIVDELDEVRLSVYGNGRPGLKEDVIVNKRDIEQCRRDIQAIKKIGIAIISALLLEILGMIGTIATAWIMMNMKGHP